MQGKTITGRVNTWGGPNDAATAPNEGLALIDLADLPKFSKYFLPESPPGTSGLARRLNPASFYVAARWNYEETPKSFLKSHLVTVTNPKSGKSAKAQPVDWGPSVSTGRVADISPGLAAELGLHVDDTATIEIPKAM